MNDTYSDDRETVLDTVAAELTLAAYGVVLQIGTPGNWADLELGLWRVLAGEVRARGIDGWLGDRRVGRPTQN
jgi:hypothetical protein